MGIWRCSLSILMVSNDSGTMGRTRSRIRVLEGLDSAAFLYDFSCRCYIAEASRRVMAKPEELGTGFQLLNLTEVIIVYAPVAMWSITGRVVGL